MTATGAKTGLFTVRDAVVRGAEYLQARGSATARLDAELLVGEALGMDRLQLFMNMDRPLDAGERERARNLVMRRGRLEPVAYILGRREFYGHEFEVTKATLIPRPETEFLVDSALEILGAMDRLAMGSDQRNPDEAAAEAREHAAQFLAAGVESPATALVVPVQPRRVLEVGAGSGCVAVSLALGRPGLEVVATEMSEEAAEVARRNADRHGVGNRVSIRVQSDLQGLEALAPFDGLVSNPPYVAERDRASLSVDVRDWEPETALFSGHDGLDCIRWLLSAAPALLSPGAFGVIEIGHDQSSAVTEIAERAGWLVGGFRRDYGGHDRIALLQWNGHL